jgi:hypothetical protein
LQLRAEENKVVNNTYPETNKDPNRYSKNEKINQKIKKDRR